jgi:hypothetical protein
MSGSNRNPQNIHIYSCGYDPSPSLTLNHFPIFEIGSSLSVEMKKQANIFNQFLTYHMKGKIT